MLIIPSSWGSQQALHQHRQQAFFWAPCIEPSTPSVVHEKNKHAMTLVDPYVVHEKNRHARTLVDPYVVHEKYRHAMTLVDLYMVHEKNRQAMTLVDPYVVCLEEHTCNDTGGSLCGLYRGTYMQSH